MVAALLIDMDGTLVDTEPYWMEAERALVADHGDTWTEADAHSIVGYDLLHAADALRDRGGVTLSREEAVDWMLNRVIERCRVELPWRPGARELLVDCRARGVPVVLVTMSWRSLADAVLHAAPADTFTGSVTGDEVSRGKPDPEPYLTACDLLAVDPGDCIAIEDSPTGVQSAWRAGCRTICIPHIVQFDPPDGVVKLDTLAGRTLADLDELTR